MDRLDEIYVKKAYKIVKDAVEDGDTGFMVNRLKHLCKKYEELRYIKDHVSGRRCVPVE